jgi:methionyl-tRNA formyltransferase
MILRVLVMTGHRRGIASRCLPSLCETAGVDVAGVVFVAGAARDPKRELRRKIAKARRIGVLGALNGLRLRGWYADPESEDVEAVAASCGVPFHVTPSTNDSRTVALFREARPDLGLSLGNGYIAERVFSIPTHGMLNCHGEILPDFKGAQSVIWPIYEGATETGFSIHLIGKAIDGGPIVYCEKHPIVFRPTLRETVEASVDVIRRRIPERLAYVCAEYESLGGRAAEQRGGRSYTTPTAWQYLRMVRNHRHLYAAAVARETSRAESVL